MNIYVYANLTDHDQHGQCEELSFLEPMVLCRLPYIPRIGEEIWLTDKDEDRLTKSIKKWVPEFYGVSDYHTVTMVTTWPHGHKKTEKSTYQICVELSKN